VCVWVRVWVCVCVCVSERAQGLDSVCQLLQYRYNTFCVIIAILYFRVKIQFLYRMQMQMYTFSHTHARMNTSAFVSEVCGPCAWSCRHSPSTLAQGTHPPRTSPLVNNARSTPAHTSVSALTCAPYRTMRSRHEPPRDHHAPGHAREPTPLLPHAPASVCEGEDGVAVPFALTPLPCIAASRPHRRQPPPATPLRQPPQPAPARARCAAGCFRRGARTSLHWDMFQCRGRFFYHHATRPRTCQPPAQASAPPPQPLCVSPLSLPRRVRTSPRDTQGRGRAPLSIGPCVGALPVRLPAAVRLPSVEGGEEGLGGKGGNR
jgi:hypothetical protein